MTKEMIDLTLENWVEYNRRPNNHILFVRNGIELAKTEDIDKNYNNNDRGVVVLVIWSKYFNSYRKKIALSGLLQWQNYCRRRHERIELFWVTLYEVATSLLVMLHLWNALHTFCLKTELTDDQVLSNWHKINCRKYREQVGYIDRLLPVIGSV